jgi:hypothetical protein
MANIPPRLTWHSDPGHAWLVVPVSMLTQTGVAQQISPFSYISPGKRVAYLEEDTDAPRFLQACRSQGIQIETTERHTNHSHRIRRLQSYSPAGGQNQ